MALTTLAQFAQSLIGEDACPMPIFPHGSQAVSSNRLNIHQRRLFPGQAFLILQHTWHATFTRAPRTWTRPAQPFPVMHALMTIAPLQEKATILFVKDERGG